MPDVNTYEVVPLQLRPNGVSQLVNSFSWLLRPNPSYGGSREDDLLRLVDRWRRLVGLRICQNFPIEALDITQCVCEGSLLFETVLTRETPELDCHLMINTSKHFWCNSGTVN